MPHHFMEVLLAQRGSGVALEAMEETEAASYSSGSWAPLEEEMSSTELETGIIPVCAVENRTSPVEDIAASVKAPKPKGFLPPLLGGD